MLLENPGEYYQRVRSPEEVVGGVGTCLDLAVLFSGLCLNMRLLPMLVLLRGTAAGGRSRSRRRRSQIHL